MTILEIAAYGGVAAVCVRAYRDHRRDRIKKACQDGQHEWQYFDRTDYQEIERGWRLARVEQTGSQDPKQTILVCRCIECYYTMTAPRRYLIVSEGQSHD